MPASSPISVIAALAAPIRSSSLQRWFPHGNGTGHFETKGAVRGSLRARTVQLAYRMGQRLPLTFPHPHRQVYRHARSVNGGAALRVTSALTGDCRCACRLDSRHRDREHQEFRAPRGFDQPLAGSNREHKFCSEAIRTLPIPLTPPPARHNHSAFNPGLNSHAVI